MRKYYYRHYGGWGGWEFNADDRTKELYRISKMTNVPMFVGMMVHDTINHILEELEAGRIVEQENAKKSVIDKFKRGWSQSKRKEWQEDPKRKANFFEHYYDVALTDEELLEARDKMVESINGFYESESFHFIKQLSKSDWLTREELVSYDFEGTPVFVKLDFAAKHGERVYVYDWKSGKKAFQDDVQLSVYALYAMKRWDITLENLRLFDVYLIKRLPVKLKVNQPMIEETKILMRKSITEMKELLDDQESNVASEDKFPMIDNTSVCAKCEYKGICYPDSWQQLE